MVSPWFDLVVFLVAGLTFPLVNIGVSVLLRRDYPYPEKLMPYESGEQVMGDARVKFRIAYYFFAMEFLIFDVEAVFLFPWVLAIHELGLFSLVAGLIFIALLGVGLVYSYKKKVLQWV